MKIFVFLSLIVGVISRTDKKWQCAKYQAQRIQSCTDQSDEAMCVESGRKFLECFPQITRDYQMGITRGLGTQFFIDSSAIKTDRKVLMSYNMDPTAYSSSAYTLLHGDVKGHIVLITGEADKIKTRSFNSWFEMLRHNTEANVMFAEGDSVILEPTFANSDVSRYLSSITDNERATAEDDIVVIPGKYANPFDLNGKLDHHVVFANKMKDTYGNHFLEVAAVMRPMNVMNTPLFKMVSGNLRACTKCDSTFLTKLEHLLSYSGHFNL